MNIAILTNALTIVFCIAVLVQSVRMMRSLRTVKDGALTQVVEALDKSTGQARAVLSELKVILATDCAANARLIDQAKALRDELSDMIGIADATAERIVSAVGLANALRTDDKRDDGEADAPLIEDDGEIDAESLAEKLVGKLAAEDEKPAAKTPAKTPAKAAPKSRARAKSTPKTAKPGNQAGTDEVIA